MWLYSSVPFTFTEEPPHYPEKKLFALKNGDSFSNFYIKLLYDGRLLFSILELIKEARLSDCPFIPILDRDWRTVDNTPFCSPSSPRFCKHWP